jgi:hypothetical protein
MKNYNFIFAGVLAAVFLFAANAMPLGVWISSNPLKAQSEGSNQTAVLDQLVSNLTQAKEAVGVGTLQP